MFLAGRFPDAAKLAIVSPVHKKNDVLTRKTTVPSELIMLRQLNPFLDDTLHDYMEECSYLKRRVFNMVSEGRVYNVYMGYIWHFENGSFCYIATYPAYRQIFRRSRTWRYNGALFKL
eukprot:GHVO01065978.1.p1 GENE.GHVO01065978.1~~GHVO01065978.1.p1  ORF type:complete len:118 (+),score=0.50 GHVO01065978.1:666-1019(+)